MAVNLHATHFRFGIEELLEATHGWHAALDTNPAQGVIANDTTFLLRATIQETGGTAAANTDTQFQCRLNAGAFQNITTTSTIVKAVVSVAFTNGQACTKRLTGTGTFETSGAGCTEDGLSGGAANDIAASGNSETECGLQIVGADVANNDVIEFRWTSPDFTITNDVVPSLTVSVPLTATRGTVSWAEFETPLVATRGLVSFTEFETPLVGTRGLASWTELETPDPSGPTPTRGVVSWTELETPAGPTRGLVSWAEFETTTTPTRGLCSVTEFEVIDPPSPTRGLVSWLEWEHPTPPTRGIVSALDLQCPLPNATVILAMGGASEALTCEVGVPSGRIYVVEGNWVVVYERGAYVAGQWVFHAASREPRDRASEYPAARWEG